jgi:hypothetical protein
MLTSNVTGFSLLLSVAFFGLLVLAVGESYGFAESLEASALATSPSSATVLSEQRLETMANRLESLEKFQSAVLSTVYWSLGTVGSLTAILLGFGWFTNLRLYERDKEILREQVTNWTKRNEIEVADLLRRSANEIEERIASRIPEIVQNNFAIAQEELRSAVRNLSRRIDDMEYNALCQKIELQKDSISNVQDFARLIELAPNVDRPDDVRHWLDMVYLLITEKRKYPIMFETLVLEWFQQCFRAAGDEYEVAITAIKNEIEKQLSARTANQA